MDHRGLSCIRVLSWIRGLGDYRRLSWIIKHKIHRSGDYRGLSLIIGDYRGLVDSGLSWIS